MAEEQKQDGFVKQTGKAAVNEGFKRGARWAAGKAAAKIGASAAMAGASAGTSLIVQAAIEAGSKMRALITRYKGGLGKVGATALAAPFILGATVVGAIGAGLAALGSAIIISVIAIPLTVAFFLLIINNSAYMVPPSTGSAYGPGAGPGIDVGATCPIPNGEIFLGVYGARTSVYPNWGHGENGYWPGVGVACGAYAISGCFARVPTDCAAEKGMCSTFGLAIDVRYRGGVGNSTGKEAYYPYINGKTSEWVLSTPNRNCNCAGTVRTVVDGNVYEMYVSHLTTLPKNGQSGSPIGILDAKDHIHIELMINGQWVDPTSMCSGNNTPPNSSMVNADISCAEAGGECINTPSCLRSNLAPMQGSCAVPSFTCCSKTPAQTEDIECATNGGTCYDPVVIGLLTETYQPATKCEDVSNLQTAGVCSNNKLCCSSK